MADTLFRFLKVSYKDNKFHRNRSNRFLVKIEQNQVTAVLSHVDGWQFDIIKGLLTPCRTTKKSFTKSDQTFSYEKQTMSTWKSQKNLDYIGFLSLDTWNLWMLIESERQLWNLDRESNYEISVIHYAYLVYFIIQTERLKSVETHSIKSTATVYHSNCHYKVLSVRRLSRKLT